MKDRKESLMSFSYKYRFPSLAIEECVEYSTAWLILDSLGEQEINFFENGISFLDFLSVY